MDRNHISILISNLLNFNSQFPCAVHCAKNSCWHCLLFSVYWLLVVFIAVFFAIFFAIFFVVVFLLLLSVFPGWRDTQKNVAACCVYSTFLCRLRLCDNNKANKEVAASSSSTRVQLWQTAGGNVLSPIPHPSLSSCPSVLQLVLSCCLSPARGTEQRTVNYDLQHLQPPAVAFLDDGDGDDDDDFDSATLASTLSLSPQCNWNSNNNNSNSNSSGSNHSSGSSNSC